MRRNAELEAKSGKAAKNATMILNSTTTMYKENSFLDNFRATSGPETIDSSAVTESADNAAAKHQTPPQSPYRKTPPMSPEVQKAAKRSSEKHRRSALQQRKNSTTPSHSSLNSTPSRKGSSSKSYSSSRSRSDISLDSTPQSSVMRSNLQIYQKARIVVLEEECLRGKRGDRKPPKKKEKLQQGICRQ